MKTLGQRGVSLRASRTVSGSAALVIQFKISCCSLGRSRKTTLPFAFKDYCLQMLKEISSLRSSQDVVLSFLWAKVQLHLFWLLSFNELSQFFLSRGPLQNIVEVSQPRQRQALVWRSEAAVDGSFHANKQFVWYSLEEKDNNRPYRWNLAPISSSVIADSVSSHWQLLKLNMKILLLQIEESWVLVSASQPWLMSRFHQFKPWWIVRFSSSSFSHLWARMCET